ncbi:TonB-dependent siderophore receptor [Chlorogloeopsis sp. ULAP02]|uniref:TonB-dependent siderophore receptor n=1 Tax=Chlorogloeopsis sp. ULAP02 TaxID=3107926 RepID=UPI0031374B55
MKSWRSLNAYLSLVVSTVGIITAIFAQPVQALELGKKQNTVVTRIKRVSETEFPATSVKDLLSQSPKAEIIAITGVKANPTDKGVEVILETTLGEQLQVTNRSTGNNFIAEISGGQLRLPSGEAFTFRSEKPIAGITEITVANVDTNTVRVTVIGETALPTVELFDDNVGLVFGITSQPTATQPPQQPETPQAEEKPTETPPTEAAQEDEPIELVVTGEQDGYRVPNASTATLTDTPIRDIPQSIQIVPQEVLRDRNAQTVFEAVETVSGVLDGSSNYGAPGGANIIRGFNSFDSGSLRNGFRDYDYYSVSSIGTIEQVEVLKGPASVLFSSQEPGGVINIVTKKPLSTPFYNVAFEAGNYGFYQPSIDFSGPLTTDGNVLYRFIASYRGAGGYQDFFNSSTTTIAPSITLKLGDRTDLNLSYEYVRYFADAPQFEVPLLSDGSLPPRNFYPAYPDLVLSDITTNRIGYTLNHRFSENWQIRNNLAIVLNQRVLNRVIFGTVVDERILTDAFAEESSSYADNYFGQIDLLGKFNTGSISHQLLAGFDVNYLEGGFRSDGATTVPDLDIFNPNYDIPKPEYLPGFAADDWSKNYGFYLQDQIAFSDNLKLLIGGRYDWVSSEYEILGNDIDEQVEDNGAFSPRIGLVYQPSDTVSLYASYSRSFKLSPGYLKNPDGRGFEPSRGTQYEVGVKTDFLDRKLSATLAAYHITKTNVTTPDPNDPSFSIQTGEVRSQGIELDVAGEILPGWKIIASYAYTDAEVTEDNTIPVGNQLESVPFNQASLWTTYEIQKGNLRGLGFGLGLFYIGDRQGDLANSFELPSYLRTDAALYYRRDGFDAAINIRNLFDIDYVNYSAGRFVQRGAPFTIIGSIGWTF